MAPLLLIQPGASLEPETAPGPAPLEARHLSLDLEFCDWRRWGGERREREGGREGELRDTDPFGERMEQENTGRRRWGKDSLGNMKKNQVNGP